MPIYEYLCGACGHVLDALQKHSDEPLVHCPHCGEPQLKRQLSAPSFRLKGGGWYETDFKSDKRRNIAESDSAAGGKDAGGKDKAAPEAKPAAAKADAPAKPDKPAAGKASGGKAGDVV